jgi:hypothetical protein
MDLDFSELIALANLLTALWADDALDETLLIALENDDANEDTLLAIEDIAEDTALFIRAASEDIRVNDVIITIIPLAILFIEDMLLFAMFEKEPVTVEAIF